MNTFVAVVALTISALIHFEAIQTKEELTVKLALLLLAGIFF